MELYIDDATKDEGRVLIDPQIFIYLFFIFFHYLHMYYVAGATGSTPGRGR